MNRKSTRSQSPARKVNHFPPKRHVIQAPKSPEHRGERILDLLATNGFSSVSDLALAMKVSEMTIRRDLDKLESEGHIRRTHGGAVTESRTQIEINYRDRQKRLFAEKEQIGKLASKLVKNGQCIFIDAGTTTLAMVKHLKMLRDLKIVTNSLPVQAEFLDSKTNEVILIGGTILTHTLSLVGALAQENVANMHFDWAFLGTGGIDLKRGLTHSTMEEIPIKKNAAKSSAQVAVLADHTKFGYKALSLFMPIGKIDVIVTNKRVDTAVNLNKKKGKTQIIWP